MSGAPDAKGNHVFSQTQAFPCPYKVRMGMRSSDSGAFMYFIDRDCALPAGHKGPCSAEPGTIVPKSGGRQ